MATTYLTHTNSGTGSYQKSTFSAWVKRSSLGTIQTMWNNQVQAGVNQVRFEFDAADKIYLYGEEGGGYALRALTTSVYRDLSAWYHVLVIIDTPQSAAADRIKLYVNGVQVTLTFSTTPAQNANLRMNYNSTPVYVGSNATASYFDGLMSHVHWIDGTAYPASTFGSVDATSGIWSINTSPSVTYGTNGFFILKDGNTITDSSPNSNNFSLGGGTLTKTEDCPANVFCVLNALDTTRGLSNGNTTYAGASSGTVVKGTLGMSSGKYYAECKVLSSAENMIGVLSMAQAPTTTFVGKSAVGWGMFGNGYIYNNASSSGSSGNSFSDNDIMGIALDMDNNKLYFSKNGVFLYSGDPTSGATGTGATSITSGLTMTFCGGRDNTSDTANFNFGNGYFGTTAVTTNSGNGYAGAEGASKFNYQPPTGYSALSTKGLNL